MSIVVPDFGTPAVASYATTNGAEMTEPTIDSSTVRVMENAGLCQMGGMTPIPVTSAIKRFPEDFRP